MANNLQISTFKWDWHIRFFCWLIANRICIKSLEKNTRRKQLFDRPETNNKAKEKYYQRFLFFSFSIVHSHDRTHHSFCARCLSFVLNFVFTIRKKNNLLLIWRSKKNPIFSALPLSQPLRLCVCFALHVAQANRLHRIVFIDQTIFFFVHNYIRVLVGFRADFNSNFS